MDKVIFLITLCYSITIIKGMVLSDGSSHLDFLFQKSLRYKHHKENYQTSLRDGVTPPRLRIKKEAAFLPVTEDFNIKWQSVLYDAEKR